jgi:hypothetical protein
MAFDPCRIRHHQIYAKRLRQGLQHSDRGTAVGPPLTIMIIIVCYHLLSLMHHHESAAEAHCPFSGHTLEGFWSLGILSVLEMNFSQKLHILCSERAVRVFLLSSCFKQVFLTDEHV